MNKPVPQNEPKEISPDPPSEEELSSQGLVKIDERYLFSGPIPPPTLLEDYERALPGSADRIISMAEREQNHHHKQEVRGWFSGTVIAILALAGSLFVIVSGQSLVGFAGVLIAASGLIANFFSVMRVRKSPPDTRNDT